MLSNNIFVATISIEGIARAYNGDDGLIPTERAWQGENTIEGEALAANASMTFDHFGKLATAVNMVWLRRRTSFLSLR